jgi:dihydrodipicolinate synthase/N-acetylneuraminate lyase
MSDYPMPPNWVLEKLRAGQVIPAHPLALTQQRRLDERRQRALTRYYHAAGSGGIAVGVHTTQFAIRDPKHSLFEPVLKLAGETIASCDAAAHRQTVRVAGICGATSQAAAEARFARETGYHAGLLSLGALRGSSDAELLEHCQSVAREIPLFGFYLQPAAGGRILALSFWCRFVEIPNAVAIKIAPFNRYQTFDVVRAVAESGRDREIALYTGNDDSIVADLLTEYSIPVADETATLRIVGGLLGHWACWTRSAVELLEHCQAARTSGTVSAKLLTLGAQVTDCNAAFFDAANGFAGCIPGIHEVLRRQGLLENTLCLNPAETLSAGQKEEIDRVYHSYPELNDDAFVQANLDRWLS